MARYRRLRTDFFSHPRTAGLSPLARILMLRAMCENIVGILAGSPRRLAAIACPGVSPDDIDDAIVELVDAGVARWWDELETLWIIEAADEQTTSPRSWESAWGCLHNQPEEVRRAFAARYGPTDGETPQGSGGESTGEAQAEPIGESPVQESGTGTGSRSRKQETHARADKLRTVETAKLEADQRLLVAKSLLTEWGHNRPPKCRAWGTGKEQQTCADLLGTYGAPMLQRVVDSVAERVRRAELKPEDWSKLWARDGEIFAIRLTELEQGDGAEPSTSPDEARAHYERTGSLPPGWEMLSDRTLVPAGARRINGRIELEDGTPWEGARA